MDQGSGKYKGYSQAIQVNARRVRQRKSSLARTEVSPSPAAREVGAAAAEGNASQRSSAAGAAGGAAGEGAMLLSKAAQPPSESRWLLAAAGAELGACMGLAVSEWLCSA